MERLNMWQRGEAIDSDVAAIWTRSSFGWKFGNKMANAGLRAKELGRAGQRRRGNVAA